MNNILFLDIKGKIHFSKETSINRTVCGKRLSLYSQINLSSPIFKNNFSYKKEKEKFCSECELINNKLDYE